MPAVSSAGESPVPDGCYRRSASQKISLRSSASPGRSRKYTGTRRPDPMSLSNVLSRTRPHPPFGASAVSDSKKRPRICQNLHLDLDCCRASRNIRLFRQAPPIPVTFPVAISTTPQTRSLCRGRTLSQVAVRGFRSASATSLRLDPRPSHSTHMEQRSICGCCGHSH